MIFTTYQNYPLALISKMKPIFQQFLVKNSWSKVTNLLIMTQTPIIVKLYRMAWGQEGEGQIRKNEIFQLYNLQFVYKKCTIYARFTILYTAPQVV